MKSYAFGESETDQGYVKHYTYEDSDDADWLFYFCLLMIVEYVSAFLTCRLCSKLIRNIIDGMVQIVVESILAVLPKAQSSPQMIINDVESNNTAADDATESDITATNAASSEGSDKYLTIVSRMEYIVMYALFVIVFTAYDTILYNNRTGSQIGNWDYFPIPMQIIISTFCSIAWIMLYGTQCMIRNKCNRKKIKQDCLKHWEECAAILFITVLTNYILVHVFWILLLLVSFPVLVALKGIFLIPLSLPVIIMLQRIFSCFKICYRHRWHPVSVNDFRTYLYAAFLFLNFWIPLLFMLYHISKYLLDASEISNDPLKLIIILFGAIFIMYRVAKVWGYEFFLKRRQTRHVNTRDSENTPISTTNNNNYNTV